MNIDMERKVVVYTIGEIYVGDLPKSLPANLDQAVNRAVSPEEYMDVCHSMKIPVTLLNARVLFAQRGLRMSPPGPGGSQILGMEQVALLVPLHVSKGPIGPIYVIPTTWLFPKDHKDLKVGYERLLVRADEEEKRASAAEVLDLNTRINPKDPMNMRLKQ